MDRGESKIIRVSLVLDYMRQIFHELWIWEVSRVPDCCYDVIATRENEERFNYPAANRLLFQSMTDSYGRRLVSWNKFKRLLIFKEASSKMAPWSLTNAISGPNNADTYIRRFVFHDLHFSIFVHQLFSDNWPFFQLWLLNRHFRHIHFRFL